jgi:Flp pilus assembly protein TadG
VAELRNRWKRSEHGQTLAEFAMIAPVFLILLFAFVDMSRLYQSWVTIQGAAREGARYGVTGQDDCTGITDNRVACIQYLARQRNKTLANGVSATVKVRRWDYPNYANPALENDAGMPCDALEVEVDYNFKATTPMFTSLFGAISIKARERLVNEPWQDCV